MNSQFWVILLLMLFSPLPPKERHGHNQVVVSQNFLRVAQKFFRQFFPCVPKCVRRRNLEFKCSRIFVSEIIELKLAVCENYDLNRRGCRTIGRALCRTVVSQIIDLCFNNNYLPAAKHRLFKGDPGCGSGLGLIFPYSFLLDGDIMSWRPFITVY